MASEMNSHGVASPDVVVVGSGPSGVSVAWPLCRAGVNVLMIDASDERSLPIPTAENISRLRTDPSRWKQQVGESPAGVEQQADSSPKLSTPRAQAAMDGFSARARLSAEGFTLLGSMAQGGLSTIWGALVNCFDDDDLVEYPIKRSDLDVSYRTVMDRIGVSGGELTGDLPIEHGPELSVAARSVMQHYDRARPRSGLRLQLATNAVLMHDRAGRQGCNSSGLCLWGCPRKSIYDSGYELPELKNFNNFCYRPGFALDSILPSENGHLLAIRSSQGPIQIATSHVVLAAGTLATTGLVLRRLGLRHGSIRLHSNPVAAFGFVVPKAIGHALPDRTFALAQLIYQVSLGARGHAGGAFYAADTLPLQNLASRIPLTRPTALRLARALAPALLLTTCYLPSRYSSNRLSMQSGRDGEYIKIEGEQTAEATRLLREVKARLARALLPYGAVFLPGSLTIAPPGSDAHYAGTLPMGTNGVTGSSKYGEINGLPGLFAVDGSILPQLPWKHCTLTIMANADRIGRYLADKLRTQVFSPSRSHVATV
jgi:choline dehydrogenase-like flavoprotein